jgi:PAS domain S-box-containing protein
MWGYRPKELIGQHYLHMVVEEDKEKTIKAIKDLVAGAALTNFENRYIAKKGTLVPVEWSAIWDAATQEMYCIARDATEKKKAEAQLKKQEKRLERAKNMAKIGYWEYDLKQQKGFATDGLYEIYGVCRKQHPHVTIDLFLSLIHPDDKPIIEARVSALLTEPMSDLEHRIIRPDGRLVYVYHSGETVKDENGEPLHISGAVQDITERKKAEISLSLSEQKFKSLVQNGSDLIFIIDELAVVQYVSPTIKDMAGYDPHFLIGQKAFDYLHQEDIPEIATELMQIKQFTNNGAATAHRFLKQNGEWMWLESKGANLLNDANIQGIVVNSRDITDRIHLQEKLDKELANRQKKITAAVIKAQEAERSQLGQELHDNVNQVLTTVKLYNEMLLHDMGNKEDILKKSLHHLQGCIDEIRSISKRLSAPTLGKISLVDSVLELVESINITNKLSIHYSFEGFEGIVVSQDVHLTIYRIIQEQLNNIIKHAEAQNVFLKLKSTNHQLLLIIRDDGKGFDLDERRRGIGITNMITRAENMNGNLTLTTEPDNGCILKVTLPITASSGTDLKNKNIVY